MSHCHSFRIAGVAALGVLAEGGDAWAQATMFDCPANRIETQVVTRLPGNWVGVNQQAQLSGVETAQGRGGNQVLTCRYGGDARNPVAVVQIQVGGFAECRTQGMRFACTSAPQTHSTGLLEVRQTFTFDLDAGQTGGARNRADVWFQAETNDLLYLEPMNGAQLSVGNRSNRGRDGCAAARYSSSRVSLRDIPVGSYICARTNEGRISQFRVNGLSSGSPRTLSLGYTTWR